MLPITLKRNKKMKARGLRNNNPGNIRLSRNLVAGGGEAFARQVVLPVPFDDIRVPCAYQAAAELPS